MFRPFMAATHVKCTIVGSSFVRRLKDDIATSADPQFSAHFGIQNARISYVCRGGWKLQDVQLHRLAILLAARISFFTILDLTTCAVPLANPKLSLTVSSRSLSTQPKPPAPISPLSVKSPNARLALTCQQRQCKQLKLFVLEPIITSAHRPLNIPGFTFGNTTVLNYLLLLS